MSKNKDKNRVSILRLDPPREGCKIRAKSSKPTVFDKDDFDFGSSKELDEWDKLWKGQPSALDDIDPEEEYFRATEDHKKRQRASPKRKPVFEDNDSDYGTQEPDEWDKLWKGQPSALDDIDPEEEYFRATEDHKKRQRASPERKTIFEDDEVEEEVKQEKQAATLAPLIFNAESQVVREDNADEYEEMCLAMQIAQDLVEKENIRCVGGALYRFNGKFFVLLDDFSVQRLTFQKYRKEVGKKNTVSILRNVATLLRFCIAEEHDEFPINPNIIVFENGTFEVGTGNFRKNSPKDLACSALGINYDSTCWRMPYTQYFLKTIADGDNDLYELMLQVMGYIFSNDVKAKSFFYLEGVGDAGKSRFCDLIASFFPVSGTNKVARIALQDLGGKFALGNLVNAKLNISEDLPDSPLSPTTVSRIKMLSDSNRLEAEAKYVQPFSFRPTCKLLFASNHQLRLKEYDAAFVNRVVYIPFLHPIPKHKQDKNILEKMQMELSALFNHAIEAYKRLVANGYVWAGSDIFKPQIAIVGSGLSLDREQTLRHFVESCCEYDENYIISVFELQEAYYTFCRKQKYTPVMGDRFSRELLTILPETVTRTKIGNQRRGFKGIRLNKEYKGDVF